MTTVVEIGLAHVRTGLRNTEGGGGGGGSLTLAPKGVRKKEYNKYFITVLSAYRLCVACFTLNN